MKHFSSPQRRWAGVGPYYAMFPARFADRVVLTHSRPGELVLDPFAGRGTAVFSAAVQGRIGIGIEINPVGWIYAQTKLEPATKRCVEERVREIGRRAMDYRDEADGLPLFFHRCYRKSVRAFLLAARQELDWKGSKVDRTLMALLLVHLHGKPGNALSNQMRQTKAMSPAYAIRWWRRNNSKAPNLNPVEYMLDRLDWRYAQGRPMVSLDSRTYLGDSTDVLGWWRSRNKAKADLLFTSPPYFRLTNYHYDQWLRLWMLGEAPNARRKPGNHRAKFEGVAAYASLLHDVFVRSAQILGRQATVYVRTGRDKTTYSVTREALTDVFPRHRLIRRVQPFVRPTQTTLFGDHEQKIGEVDLILLRN